MITMKNFYYAGIFIILLSSCTRRAPRPLPGPELTLITTTLQREEEYLRTDLTVLFNEFRDAYSADQNSTKDYFDHTRYLNRISNELRQIIKERISIIAGGRDLGEDDLRTLDEQVKEYARKTKIVVKQPQMHSEHSRFIANREMDRIYPVDDWIYNSLNEKAANETKLFLALLLNDVYRAEIGISQSIFADMTNGGTGNQPALNNYKLAASPSNPEIDPGQEMKVELFIQSVNKGENPVFVIGDYDTRTDSIVKVTDNKSIIYSNGRGIFKLSDQRRGEHQVEIIATITDPSTGKKMHLPLTYKYTVKR